MSLDRGGVTLGATLLTDSDYPNMLTALVNFVFFPIYVRNCHTYVHRSVLFGFNEQSF